MATLNRARVCTLGTQEDMIRLCRTLLDNCQWFDEPEDDKPDLTLDKLQAIIARHAHNEAGEGSTFCYEMVSAHPYGDAISGTCQMSIRKHPTGLYLALFTYDSETPFQPEDWVTLHRQVKLLPMLALYANDDFGLEKGMKIIAGGRIGDDWNRMGEAWLFLMAKYEEGYPPEEAVARLRKLRKTLEREDFDMSIGALLGSCIDNLSDLQEAVSDTAALGEDMLQMRTEKDYEGLFNLYLCLIEAELWDVQHVDRHLACLQSVYNAWIAEEDEAD